MLEPDLILASPEHERIVIVVSASLESGAANETFAIPVDRFGELIEAMVATHRSASVDAMTEVMLSLAPANRRSTPDAS